MQVKNIETRRYVFQILKYNLIITLQVYEQ